MARQSPKRAYQLAASRLVQVIGLGLLMLLPAVAVAQRPADEVAVRQLRQATRLQPQGQHNARLRAIRHLRDPELQPFYEALSQRDEASLKIHGLMGLAEIRQPPRLSADLIARVDDAAMQAELISAGLDDDLIQPSTMRTLLGWPGLRSGVKVLLAAELMKRGNFEDAALLRQALQAKKPSRRALAAMLLHQMGQVSRWTEKAGLNELAADQQRRVKTVLLRSALQYELDRATPWAFDLTQASGAAQATQLLALRTAMRFSHPKAVAMWQQRFTQASGPAQRIRLALLGLRLAPWLDGGAFQPLGQSDNALFQQMARAGNAIARRGGDIPDRVVALVQRQHPAVNRWALSYARDRAKPQDSQMILLGLILASRDADHLTRARQLETIAQAASLLHKQAPKAAPRLLRPILTKHADKPRLVQGILLGLIRCRRADAGQTLRGVGAFNNLQSQNLAVLLKARSGLKLTDADYSDLRTLVRGGGALRPSLRVQAAWLYLKRSGRLRAALDRAFQG
jgi:hypothetical protein